VNELRPLPMWWAGWWFVQYMDTAYRVGGWMGDRGVEWQMTKQAVVLGTCWCAWRCWVWLSSRWKIVRVS
jgi:hypothetical protein